MSINLIILISIAALAVLLMINWIAKVPADAAEHSKLMKDLEKAHCDAVRMIREIKEDEVRRLYPIGCLIPKRHKLTDDTGPK